MTRAREAAWARGQRAMNWRPSCSGLWRSGRARRPSGPVAQRLFSREIQPAKWGVPLEVFPLTERNTAEENIALKKDNTREDVNSVFVQSPNFGRLNSETLIRRCLPLSKHLVVHGCLALLYGCQHVNDDGRPIICCGHQFGK